MPLRIAQSNLKATASESCCQRGTTTFKFSTQSAVSSLPSKSKVRRHQTLPKFSEIVSPLHYCAYATGCTENRSLLTEQALPLSEEVCSGSKLLRLPVKSVLLLGCCFAAGSGYYRCQLSCFATNVDQEKPFFPMPFACRTAAKLGLCFYFACTAT